jgi:hypothetical protein
MLDLKKKSKSQMTLRIENPADYGFSILNFGSYLIFKFLKTMPSKSAISLINK